MSTPSTRGPSEEHYCSNSIRLATNVVVRYSVSPSPWSPFAPNPMAQLEPYLTKVANMKPDEFRGFIACALSDYLDSRSAAWIAGDIPEATLRAVLGRMGEPEL